jgi:hypothetical protein
MTMMIFLVINNDDDGDPLYNLYFCTRDEKWLGAKLPCSNSPLHFNSIWLHQLDKKKFKKKKEKESKVIGLLCCCYGYSSSISISPSDSLSQVW